MIAKEYIKNAAEFPGKISSMVDSDQIHFVTSEIIRSIKYSLINIYKYKNTKRVSI